jgi:hypothetical protein
MQEPEATVASQVESHDASNNLHLSGNGTHSELSPGVDGATSIESPNSTSASKRPASSSAAPPVDEATSKAVDDVLLSDVWLQTTVRKTVG